MNSIDEMIKAEREASLKQVVSKVCGRDVTRGQLSDVFDKVKNKDNWKMPIDATIVITDPFEEELLREAIIFFTGSVPKMVHLDDCTVRVKAKGYYLTIGA